MKISTILVVSTVSGTSAFAPSLSTTYRPTTVLSLGKEGNVEFGGNSWKPDSEKMGVSLLFFCLGKLGPSCPIFRCRTVITADRIACILRAAWVCAPAVYNTDKTEECLVDMRSREMDSFVDTQKSFPNQSPGSFVHSHRTVAGHSFE